MKFLSPIILILLFAACKSTVSFTEGNITREETDRKIPYQLTTPKDGENSRMVVFLNENPDTLQLASSSLTQYFSDNNYSILIPGKPGKEDPALQKSLDTKRERVYDIVSVIYRLDSLHTEQLVIIGIGEGGYLVPGVARQSQADTGVIVNAGFQSPLYEMERWLSADSLSAGFKRVLFEKSINDTATLAERIEIVKAEPYGMERIIPSSNKYWLSYYESPLLDELIELRIPTLWVNFKNYPLIAPDTHKHNEILGKSLMPIHYKLIEGSGNLNDTQQMNLLLDEVREFLNPD